MTLEEIKEIIIRLETEDVYSNYEYALYDELKQTNYKGYVILYDVLNNSIEIYYYEWFDSLPLSDYKKKWSFDMEDLI